MRRRASRGFLYLCVCASPPGHTKNYRDLNLAHAFPLDISENFFFSNKWPWWSLACDLLNAKVYINLVIYPKAKIRLFIFLFFPSVPVRVFVCAITHDLIKLESWNLAGILLYILFTRNAFFCLQNSYFTPLNPLCIFLHVCVRPTSTQTYWIARTTFTSNQESAPNRN